MWVSISEKYEASTALAKRFGVAPQTISAVITKQNWSDFNCAGELITWGVMNNA